jgi:hypothetical protein
VHHTAPYFHPTPHTVSHCLTLHHISPTFFTLHHTAPHCSLEHTHPPHTASHCSIFIQHSLHCTTLHHTYSLPSRHISRHIAPHHPFPFTRHLTLYHTDSTLLETLFTLHHIAAHCSHTHTDTTISHSIITNRPHNNSITNRRPSHQNQHHVRICLKEVAIFGHFVQSSC